MGILSPRIKVAVLRGGPSPEYDVSLKTGAHVLSLLRQMESKYEPLDIFISRDGEWHYGGLAHDPHQALRHADVVWNATHGTYSADGQVQTMLDRLKIPYTGSGVAASLMAMNKDAAKKTFVAHSLLTPQHETLSEDASLDDHLIYIFRNFLHPVIVKSATGGSSIGTKLAHGFHELKEAIKSAFKHSPKVLVEEFIRGKEATCGIVEKMRGEKIYATLPTGGHPPDINRKIEEMSKVAHQALGLRHYSSSNFIVTPRGTVYILETDASPVLHENSNVYHSLKSLGMKPHEFTDHCIKLALEDSGAFVW